MVPLGHHFGKRCPYVWGHYFVLVLQGHQNSALFVEKGYPTLTTSLLYAMVYVIS